MSAVPTGRGGVVIMPNRGLQNVKAGDVLVVISDRDSRRRTERELPVARVARSNLYIEIYGREVGFGIDDGIERRSSNAIGTPMVAQTREQVAADDKRADLMARIRQHNLNNLAYKSNDQLARIVAILDEEPTP